ncbi:DNA ligase D [Bordetella genomosp. 13]|uniref:DNA ligase (ATP) n=1 Tax=Bordetella genomosp. 13 TaxID=463040 RepID=A0A1W6Z9W8_9BORD|nr:DNA ligase D [Bordetella genomosp. 13]ARP94119.1 DNA ligase D [Bordetella genomosp. 13]
MTDSLLTYRGKRDFAATPEPSGRGGARRRRQAAHALTYVVQRHDASTLHYDFRLEWDGVLVSWAVPKGPSEDTDVKRLAVKVEDHPLDYAGFEGDIPAGHYGAGHVDIWDRGTWQPDEDPAHALERGSLRFTLQGERLRGAWSLVRMGSEGKQWLLRKLREDAPAKEAGPMSGKRRAHEAAQTQPEASARRGSSARSEAPTQAKTSSRTTSASQAKSSARTKARARRSDFPAELSPQLATLVDQPPRGEGWSYELKYDGYRILCRLEGGKARLLSRTGKDWTRRMAPLARALEALDLPDGWLDGEVVALDARGMSDFQRLQNTLDGNGKDLRYVVFDLPWWDGEDLRKEPLHARQDRLAGILESLPDGTPMQMTQRLQVADHTEGAAALTEACRLSLEGLICKKLDAPYSSTRSASWLKLKCRPRQEFVIGGYTEPAGSRKHLGALLLGLREGNKLRYAGRVGTGFNAATLRGLAERLEPLRAARSPFAAPAPADKAQIHWVKPQLVAEVRYAGITTDGLLRQAAFVGLREDKPADEVADEVRTTVASIARENTSPAQAAKTKNAAASGKTTSTKAAKTGKKAGSRATSPDAGGNVVRGITITHPDRVVFHDPDLTKLDVARYYESVGDLIMPHLQGRRVALLRCPEGTASQCFFQRHLSPRMPDGVARSGGHLAIESLEGLIGLAQHGVIELHTWGSREPDPDRPDRITLDLDPDANVPWTQVVEGALHARTLMREVGLEPFLKTTGGKGLHLVAPIRATQSWDVVREFARRLAEQLVAEMPEKFVATMSKARRHDRIFVDYLRNGDSATAVAAWSLRARNGAPVSMPLDWDDLDPKRDLRGAAFNLRNALAMARDRADPWRDYAKARRTLGPRMLNRLGEGG